MSEPNKICPWELTPCEQSLATELVKVKVELEVAKRGIAALREKYRWRNHSEEPMPNDDTVILVSNIESATTMQGSDAYKWKVAICHDIYWRPLDLPEEESE